VNNKDRGHFAGYEREAFGATGGIFGDGGIEQGAGATTKMAQTGVQVSYVCQCGMAHSWEAPWSEVCMMAHGVNPSAIGVPWQQRQGADPEFCPSMRMSCGHAADGWLTKSECASFLGRAMQGGMCHADPNWRQAAGLINTLRAKAGMPPIQA